MNRPVPELPIADDSDLVETEGAGKGHHGLSLTSMITNQQDAPTCPKLRSRSIVRNVALAHKQASNCGESASVALNANFSISRGPEE